MIFGLQGAEELMGLPQGGPPQGGPPLLLSVKKTSPSTEGQVSLPEGSRGGQGVLSEQGMREVEAARAPRGWGRSRGVRD